MFKNCDLINQLDWLDLDLLKITSQFIVTKLVLKKSIKNIELTVESTDPVNRSLFVESTGPVKNNFRDLFISRFNF